MGVDALTDQGFAVTATLPTTIGLGRLVDLIIRDAHAQRLRVTPPGEQWLAWKPDTRDLVVLRPGHGVGTVTTRRNARRHQQFHGAIPEQARVMEWPAAGGAVRTLGLIESATYVSTGIHSPSKGSYHWIHQFGDRGKRGHGLANANESNPYAQRLYPRLDVDGGGNLFITRLPGNRYVVQDWIIG